MNNEVNIENDVNKKLNGIIEQQIQVVQKQKRVVVKCHQDNEAAKQKHQVKNFSFIIIAKYILLLRNSIVVFVSLERTFSTLPSMRNLK